VQCGDLISFFVVFIFAVVAGLSVPGVGYWLLFLRDNWGGFVRLGRDTEVTEGGGKIWEWSVSLRITLSGLRA
jgi:hypothetical protein